LADGQVLGLLLTLSAKERRALNREAARLAPAGELAWSRVDLRGVPLAVVFDPEAGRFHVCDYGALFAIVGRRLAERTGRN
jgi:hypothetical protein